jgi:hypothetical protein
MLLASGCLTVPIVIERTAYERIPQRKTKAGRCHDCGVEADGVHHLGCDAERCPRCGGQLISCECRGKVLIRGKAAIRTPSPTLPLRGRDIRERRGRDS